MNLIGLITFVGLAGSITITPIQAKVDGLIEVFKWKQMDFYDRGDGSAGIGNKPSGDFIFPDQYRRRSKRAITSRDSPPNIDSRSNVVPHGNDDSPSYIAYNNVPMGATHFNGRLFVTMPRRRIGIPSTLNYINMRADGKKPSPKLNAYPNIETNTLMPNFQPNPNGIISVYRTTVDACKRLWFIDTGMLEYPDNRTQVQRPAIWIMDLNTDKLIKRFEIPESVVDGGRGLASLTIDVNPKRCEQAYAYIPDLVNSQLFVYSFENDRMWAFSHNYFNFDPLAGDLTIGNQSFRWVDGIFSITLGGTPSSGQRDVFFHAMASNNEFHVSNAVLQNETNAARSDHGRDFQLLGSRGTDRQSTMHEYDPRTGVIFYADIHRNGVGCWNSRQQFTAANHDTIAQDAERMIYPSDLTIDEDGTMWVMTNSMPIFIYSNLDPNVFNFRIWKANVFAAAKNTICS